MWKYLKGTEEDFEQTLPETQCVLQPKFSGYPSYYTVISNVLFYSEPNSMFWCNSVHKNITKALEGEDAIIIAQREWVEEPHIETKPEEQPLPTVSEMNPAKDLSKIKLDIKKPIFLLGDGAEVKFIYAGNKEHVFEMPDGNILTTPNEWLDENYYNKPDIKTTVELLDSAWKRACNAGSLWASPTQLFYMAIEQLVKDGVVDMNKVYEVKQ